MSKYIEPSVWDYYKEIINDFVEKDAGLQPVLWLKINPIPGPFAEDETPVYIPIELNGLIQYNTFKMWPFNKNTESGTLNKESIVLYVTVNQLEQKNHLNQYGAWDFDNVRDKFIIKGMVYKPAGNSSAAQSSADALLNFIVLEPEDAAESKTLLNKYL